MWISLAVPALFVGWFLLFNKLPPRDPYESLVLQLCLQSLFSGGFFWSQSCCHVLMYGSWEEFVSDPPIPQIIPHCTPNLPYWVSSAQPKWHYWNQVLCKEWEYLLYLGFQVTNVTLQNWNLFNLGSPCGSGGKESACNVGDLGLIPGLGGSPGEGKGYPIQYSGLENFMDCIVHGVTKSRAQLSDFHFHMYVYRYIFLYTWN